MTHVSGYGTWPSPLTAARVTAGSLRFDHPVVDGGNLYWVEGRASEAGRYVIVRRTPDGAITDVTPAGFNVRTRVLEYGGASFTVRNGIAYFVNYSDQRLYRQRVDAPEGPEPLTAEGSFLADFSVDLRRQRLVCVREVHDRAAAGAPAREPVTALVDVSLADGAERVLAEGADFYAHPVLSPDGSMLAWIEWNHPNMPWDGTELRVARIAGDGTLESPECLAGGRRESIFQPEWGRNGELFYVSDRTGWWNLYRRGAAATAPDEPLLPMAAEFGKPLWTFSQRSYAVIDHNRLAVTFTEQGRWHLGVLQLEPRSFARRDLALEPTDGIVATASDVFFIGGSPTHPPSVVRVEADASRLEVIRPATADRIPPDWISAAEAVTFDSGGQAVHAFYYRPHNPECAAPDGERPPLMVLSHGGPTAASTDVLDAKIQFWTSRGFAVLDVNYGGSTGFGRAYRERLNGQWGIVDVEDCVRGARQMVAEGKADARRLIIRGGSAGGYTTLAALTFHDTFTAGASYYGVSDIEVLARDTHKFESRYLESLVGPYPAARDLYRERSPIHATERLSAALILFQGLEDKVVPPNQAEMMAAAVRRKGLPVAYVAFPGEQHGFRVAANIIRALEAELYFYGVVFGFTPADPIEPVAIDNLRP